MVWLLGRAEPRTPFCTTRAGRGGGLSEHEEFDEVARAFYEDPPPLVPYRLRANPGEYVVGSAETRFALLVHPRRHPGKRFVWRPGTRGGLMVGRFGFWWRPS